MLSASIDMLQTRRHPRHGGAYSTFRRDPPNLSTANESSGGALRECMAPCVAEKWGFWSRRKLLVKRWPRHQQRHRIAAAFIKPCFWGHFRAITRCCFLVDRIHSRIRKPQEILFARHHLISCPMCCRGRAARFQDRVEVTILTLQKA